MRAEIEEIIYKLESEYKIGWGTAYSIVNKIMKIIEDNSTRATNWNEYNRTKQT